MNTESDKNKKFKRTFLTSSILTLCLLAVGMSVYFSTVKKISPQSESIKPTVPSTQKIEVPSTNKPLFEESTKKEPTKTETERTTEPSLLESESDVAVLAKKDTIEREANFVLPMEGEMQKEYSKGEMVPSKTMQDWRTHNGVDFKGAVGDPVKAVNNGIVKAVYDDILWGTVVEIDHGKGMLCKYCGFGKGSTVSVGDKVKINDKVGNLGEIPIEKADGPHLHLEIYQDGKLVEPLSAIGKK